MSQNHRVGGAIFKTALEMGFGFLEVKIRGIREETVIDMEYVVDHIAKHHTVWGSCYECMVNIPSGRRRGLMFSLPPENGLQIQFETLSMPVIKQEVLLKKAAREIAKAARDPKTPPKTLKTRTDIM